MNGAAEADISRAGQGLWSIRQMTEAFGVTMRALLFYESRGLLAPHRPDRGGGRTAIRLYDSEQRRRLAAILKAKHLGFSLTAMRDLVEETAAGDDDDLPLRPDQAQAQLTLLQRQRDDLDRAIAELEAASSRLRGGRPSPALAERAAV